MDLSTTYLGLKLKNPLVASASPLSTRIDSIKKLADAGAAAVVLHSLFEEQIIQENEELRRSFLQGSESFAEALSYFPAAADYAFGPDAYLDHIKAVKKAVDIPVIASLNGVSNTGWVSYAKSFQDAGADALELNIYYLPTSVFQTAKEVEEGYVELVKSVKNAIRIPLAVKLSPYFSSMPNMAKQLQDAGANGLVLFNRFYTPDFDLDALEVKPNLKLSTSDELRLRLRWVAILAGQVNTDFAITGGVHTVEDVVKAVMAGANVAHVQCLCYAG